MIVPDSTKLLKLICTNERVYDLEIDSLLRQIANHMSAIAFAQFFEHLDDQSPDLARDLREYHLEFCDHDATAQISFGYPDPYEIQQETEEETITEYFMALVFSSQEAAFFQHELFPDLGAHYIRGSSRKRDGAAQHLRLELSHPRYLQTFIEGLRDNPHLIRVEESDATKFHKAASHGV